MDKRTAVLCVFSATILFGFIGLFSRELYNIGFNPTQINFLRNSFATLALAVIMIFFFRSQFKIKKKDLWLFILVGFTKAMADGMFIRSQLTISLSMATVLQNLTPFFIMLLTYLLFKQKITANKIIALIIALFGCSLVIELWGSGNTLNVEGVLYGLCSALIGGVFFMCSEKCSEKEYGVFSVLFYGFLFSSVALIIFMPTELQSVIMRVVDNSASLLSILGLSVLCTVLPYLLIQKSYECLDAAVVSVICICEVLSSTVVGTIFFGESITLIMVFGMALLIVSVLILNGFIHFGFLKKKTSEDQ